MIKGGNVAAGTVLFTLPAAPRPSRTKLFAVTSSSGPAAILIRNDGIVSIRSGVSARFTSLEGVIFRADAEIRAT